jgi:cytidine deaminase
MRPEQLIEYAKSAMGNAYAPYSGYLVGAALLGESGKVYIGCNVENASFSATNCAERTAVFKAVSEGERKFSAVAVVGGKNGKVTGFFPPCGVCRQVLAEFCSADMPVYLTDGAVVKTVTLGELLPHGFSNACMTEE